MTGVQIFSKVGCPFCIKTKDFLNNINVPFQEIVLDPSNPNYVKDRNHLFNTFGHKSFPVIFINASLLGGFTELNHSYNTLNLHKLCKEININIPYDF